MGLFGRKKKKKPWEYTEQHDKFISIIEDYSKDKDVLKEVIKKEPDYDVKACALMNYIPKGQYIDMVGMTNLLMNEIGLSSDETTRLIETYDAHVRMVQQNAR